MLLSNASGNYVIAMMRDRSCQQRATTFAYTVTSNVHVTTFDLILKAVPISKRELLGALRCDLGAHF